MENTETTTPVENSTENQVETTPNEGKTIAIIAHLTWVGLIIAFVMGL